MSVTVEDRRLRLRSALSAVLAVVLLIPVTILFLQVWRSATDDISAVQRERRGMEYLTQLVQLLSATSQAQAAALRGAAPPEALPQAVLRTNEIDHRLGAELGTQERWAGLRTRIEKLPQATPGQELAAYQAYTEVSDLLLALFRAVRDGSGLTRDEQTATFHLQQAAGEDLPEAFVQAARLADLTTLAPRASAAQRQQIGAGIWVGREQVTDAVNSMTDNLQAADDDPSSSTLSGVVLGGLDRFRRGVDGLVQGATIVTEAGAAAARAGNQGTGNPPAPSPDAIAAGLAQLAQIRTDTQTAAADLAATMLRETDVLLADRLDELRDRQRTALATVAAAALLALAAILLQVLGRRRSGGRQAEPVAPVPPTDATAVLERDRGDRVGAAPRRPGDDMNAQRERTDALR